MSILVQNVSKSFGATTALRDVSLELRPGEAHALLGENGAGKSTLIKMLAGLHRPTSGTVAVDGRPAALVTPQDAVASGISVVHQERHLVPGLSVAENVFLNRLPRRGPFVDAHALRRTAERWLRLVGLDVDTRRAASTLSPGQGQLVEIARALSLQSRYLLLDEPTASIGEGEVEHLFGVLRALRESGHGLLFVSHKLDEVYALCDRITVIRDGRDVVEGAQLSQVGQDRLIDAMVGRDYVHVGLGERRPAGDVALELRDVATSRGHKGVDLVVRRGEILALYGLVGAGRTELARAVVGLDRVTSGTVLVHGAPARIRTPAAALRRYGIGYVSEDCKREGLILDDTIAGNASMACWDRCATRFGGITAARTWPAVAGPLDRLAVKMRSPAQRVGELSGGNQQKVSASKWIAADVEVIFFDEPTVGIDVGAKEEMHRLLWELAGAGKAVVMISSDLREVVQLADRVVVMAGYRIGAELANSRSYDDMSRRIMAAIVRSAERGDGVSRA